MNKSVIEEYLEKVYIIVILAVTVSTCAAAAVFDVLKAMGFYPDVSETALGIFTGSCLFYLIIGFVLIFLTFKKVDGKKQTNNKMFLVGKIVIVFIVLIQFNFILYLIPSRDFWAYTFYFLILPSLFLDLKMSSVIAGGLMASLAVAWIRFPDKLLPVRDDIFIPEMILRIIAVILSCAAVLLITFLAGHYLVNAKKAEVEAGNNRVKNVLNELTAMSADLVSSTDALSDISRSTSEFAEQLSSTSTSLLGKNNSMLSKALACRTNNENLTRNQDALNEKMQLVNTYSQELWSETAKNESNLKGLIETNGAVMESTAKTKIAFEKLADDINSVLAQLAAINDIAFSTNILSINASIEAAHAGENGKSFAVVANEVGSLAKRSQKTVSEIQRVIVAVNQSISEMTAIVTDNSEKLDIQNASIQGTDSGIENMIVKLKNSIEAINEINAYFDEQKKLIGDNSTINDEISGAIEQENRDFTEVDKMLGSSVENSANIAEQVNGLQNIVVRIRELLA